MDPAVKTSLTENALEDCVNVLENANVHTIAEMRQLGLMALSTMFNNDPLVMRFFTWRDNYQEPRIPIFSRRLNCEPSLHFLSVVESVDKTGDVSPFISFVEPYYSLHLRNASTEFVPTIGLIGDAETSKSFLTSYFTDNRWIASTGNVFIYKGLMHKGLLRAVNVLDFSGATEAVFNHISKRIMPRMAYLLSDLVVMVDTMELSREECINRVKMFALEAHKSCNSMGWRPALIIITNRWTPPTVESNEDQTSEYKYIVQDLSQLFSQVAIMRTPCTSAFPDVAAKCDDQLREKIDEFVGYVQHLREHNNCCYDEVTTWYLFRQTAEWINQDILNDAPMKSLTELSDYSVRNFGVANCLIALRMYGSYVDNPSLYLQNVRKVLRWYAYLEACDRRCHFEKLTDLAEKHKAVLERCYSVEQCTATFQGPDGIVYHCRQNCLGHENFHSNPSLVRFTEEAQSLRFFGDSDVVPVRWAGRFQGAVKPEEHSVEYFLKEVDAFAALSGKELLSSFLDIQPQPLPKLYSNSSFCSLCLGPLGNDDPVRLPACFHILCRNCVFKRQHLFPVVEKHVLVCSCPFCPVQNMCLCYSVANNASGEDVNDLAANRSSEAQEIMDMLAAYIRKMILKQDADASESPATGAQGHDLGRVANTAESRFRLNVEDNTASDNFFFDLKEEDNNLGLDELADSDIEEIVTFIRGLIRLKRCRDQSIVRVSYTCLNGKFVFTLETLEPHSDATEQDLQYFRKVFGEQFGYDRVDFDSLHLVSDHKFVDAMDIGVGSTIHSNQGTGTGTIGLVVKWLTNKFTNEAAVKWGWKTEKGRSGMDIRHWFAAENTKNCSAVQFKNTEKFAIITAEHVVRQYSMVTAPRINYLLTGATNIATVADMRMLWNEVHTPDANNIKLASYYCPRKCEDVHYDIALCTLLPSANFDREKVNFVSNDKPFKGRGPDLTFFGQIDSIDCDPRHARKVDKAEYPFFLMGHHNRSYGFLLGWTEHRGVRYMRCSLNAQKGDSGGLLFEVTARYRDRNCSIRAVGILSKLVTKFRDEHGQPCAEAHSDPSETTTEAWFTPLNYLNLDSFELISQLPSSNTTPTNTTHDSTSDLGSV